MELGLSAVITGPPSMTAPSAQLSLSATVSRLSWGARFMSVTPCRPARHVARAGRGKRSLGVTSGPGAGAAGSLVVPSTKMGDKQVGSEGIRTLGSLRSCL